MREPIFLKLADVLELHSVLIQKYGGSEGVRDMNLLNSALEMPKTAFSDTYLHESLSEMTAVYGFHIAKNHPFVDGNKRTAFACMDIFLQMNGYIVTFSAEAAFDFILKIATDGFVSKLEIAKVIEENARPLDIQDIA